MPRILVIDDDRAIRSVIQALLSPDYEVETADGGRSALRVLAANRFDAILVDIFMPGMDGLETIRLLRERAPGVPLIAMSGYMVRDPSSEAPDFLGMAGKLGATYGLPKPFRPKELFRVLEKCLTERLAGSSATHAAQDSAA